MIGCCAIAAAGTDGDADRGSYRHTGDAPAQTSISKTGAGTMNVPELAKTWTPLGVLSCSLWTCRRQTAKGRRSARRGSARCHRRGAREEVALIRAKIAALDHPTA